MTHSGNPAGCTGLLENLLALVNALTEFFADRFALFAQESKTALLQLILLGTCSIGAILLSLLGYIFLIASAVVSLADVAGISWVWTALGAAGAHFAMAFVSFSIAHKRITEPFFRVTLKQLREDREWVKNLKVMRQRTS